MPESLQQLLVTNFGLSPSGYTGSQGEPGYVGSAGANGYTGSAGASGSAILISNIQVTDSSYTVLDDTAVDTAGGYIKISGSGFVSGCAVLINQTAATSVTFVSSTEVRAQLPATAAGTYIVYLVNTSGDVAIRVNGVTFSATPTWVTGSSLSGTVSTAISIQLSASSAATYSLQAGSSLPSGVTLSNVGLISGTVSGISSETVYNFTVVATDAESQDSPRSFALTISVGDTYFNYTTLLLSGNGSMSGNTAVKPFTADASTNNFAITVNGDTRTDAFNPYQAGYYSNYFDGTGDYLTVPDNSAFDLSSGDFTFEVWVYPTSAFTTGTEQFLLDQWGASIYGYEFSLITNGSSFTGLRFAYSQTGAGGNVTTRNYTQAIPLNQWSHIAFVRNSGTTTAYYNGTSVGTSSDNVTIFNSTQTVHIGASPDGSINQLFYGYLSNMRLVKGTAVYTTIFTPPTSPLTAITNTSLLTCQSNRFIDNSTNAFAITRNGDTAVRAFQPFALPSSVEIYGSGYFDGTGDVLTPPANNVFAFGTDSFCIEAWIFNNVLKNYSCLVTTRPNNSNYADAYHIGWDSAGGVSLYVNSTPTTGAPSGTITTGQWQHFVCCRDSSNRTAIFINGTRVGSDTVTNNFSRNLLGIGDFPTTPAEGINGYISNLRLVKGISVYDPTQTTITVPTSPLTAISNTALLTAQYSGASNNNAFKDSSANNFAITRVGNTTQGSFSPYGANWSNYFDGAGDYLAATSPSMSGTWTVELWWFPTVGATQQTIIAFNQGSAGSLAINIWMNTSNQLTVDNGQIASGLFTGGTFTINAWNHVAVVRNGTTTTGYINGTVVGTNTFTPGAVNNVNIGRYPDGNLTTFYYARGYISNARVVVGTAVYTSAFTPSATPLTAISGTSLLTCQSNRFVDNSTNNYAVTKFGDVSVQRFSPFSPSTVYSTTTTGGSAYFDGSGDYLDITGANCLLTGDFTVEAWVYPTSWGSYQRVISGGTSTFYWSLGFSTTWGGGLKINWYDGADYYSSAPASIPLNTWYHLAVVRTGSTIYYYINGVQSGTSSYSATPGNASGGITIGRRVAATEPWYGYITDARVVVGTNVYGTGATCTVPTTPVTAVANTRVLFSGTNAGIVDSTMMNDLETFGDVKISTAQSKFGGSSMYFDGALDFISTMRPSPNNSLGTGDFTIEMWFNGATTQVSGQTAPALITNWVNTWGANKWSIHYRHPNATAGKITFWSYSYNTGSTPLITSATTTTPDTWNHFALTRSGNTFTMWINGIADGTATTAVSMDNAEIPILYIGGSHTSGGDTSFKGYIDDLRITKGVARYTATFTPTTTAFLGQ